VGNVINLLPAAPLPPNFGMVCFFRPSGSKANPPLTHVRAASGFGENAKLGSAAVKSKIEAHLAQSNGQPIVIEASPLLLGDDILTGLDHAGLKHELFARCRSVFFCSDMYIYGPVNATLKSCAPTIDPPGQHDIYIHSRHPDGTFLRGLDYFESFLSPLTLMIAATQTNDERTLYFLAHLQSLSAADRLLRRPPADLLDRTPFEELRQAESLLAQNGFNALKYTGLIKDPGCLPDEALALYSSLSLTPGSIA